LSEIRELIKVDSGGGWWNPERNEATRFIESLRRAEELYFLMGTHRNHPYRWILIAAHVFPVQQ
jgi:hypothetical protein